MILEKSLRFDEELEVIIDFIAIDSPSRALEFYDQPKYLGINHSKQK